MSDRFDTTSGSIHFLLNDRRVARCYITLSPICIAASTPSKTIIDAVLRLQSDGIARKLWRRLIDDGEVSWTPLAYISFQEES